MKKIILSSLLLAGLLAVPATFAQEKGKKDEKAKPYPMEVCLVSGEKLGGMGDPYVFTHEGQEIKLCCKSCLKEFKKDPAKQMKKLADAKKPKK